MSDSRFPGVPTLAIARFVGPLAFSRGEAYARDGRVNDIEWVASEPRLSGVVQGSEALGYRCTVVFERRGELQVIGSSCTCPIGYACKHAAAVMCAANDDLEREDVAPADPGTGWREGLAALLDPATPDARAPQPIALQFSLRERAPRSRSRWQAARDEEATTAASVDRLGMRPVTVGSRGGWIKGTLTWENVGYLGRAGGFDPAVARWFRELAVIRRARSLDYGGGSTDWLSLDDFDSELLWPLLEGGLRLGVPLVGTNAATNVTVGRSAAVGLDARRSEDGSLTLTPTVVIDDRPVDPSSVRAIGGHGVYAFDIREGAITLAPSPRPLGAPVLALLRSPESVLIPAEDADEFLGEHYRRLERAVSVTSSDESFEPPPSIPATLVLAARFEPAHVLSLAWSWEHSDGRASPLGAPDSEFDDPQHERAAERAAIAVLEHLDGGGPALATDGAGGLRASVILRGVDAAEFADRALFPLSNLDRVRVDVEGHRPDYRELREPPVLRVTTVESERTDWFDLGVMLTVEGRKVPFGPLFTALAKGRKKLLLADNAYLSLDQPVFEPLRALIDEAGTLDEWETGVSISRYQTSLWSEFEDLADESEPAVAWRETVAGLKTTDAPPPIDPPSGLALELRAYQLEGFRWLAFLHAHRLGGILADDMGLGKTAQTLALIAHARQQGDAPPFLVVAPTSVVSNWAIEAARFVPGLRVATVSATEGASGQRLGAIAADMDIVLTTYAILRIDSDRFSALEWGGLVLDEAQFVKNAASKAHRAARDIRAPFRLAVTGTPMENNLLELWALFQIVAPGLFPSRRAFSEKFQRPIETDRNTERLARLRRRIRPLMLRRSKEQVAPELPPKQEQVVTVPLDPRHRRLYDTFLQRERQKLLGLIDDLDRNRFIVFRSLTLLRMLSLDAALIDDEAYAGIPSSKLDALFEHLDDVLAEGHRTLVFSQFTSFLKRAADRLDAAGIPYAYLDGSTRRRPEVIRRFREGDAPVFLISLKAGGFGLNLTEADYVFLLDPWWNPASEAQAVDRAHRIGQDRTVMVYRLVAEGTIEEKVMALKERKAELTSSVLDDEALFSEALTADDIRSLLE